MKQVLIAKRLQRQEINRDHFMVLGERFEENINVPQGKEGVMFSSGNGNEEDIRNIFNLFQRRDIEAKLVYKFGDIDYKSYFEDTPLEVDGKTFFANLKAENVILASYIENHHFTTDTQLNEIIDVKDNQRYDFYNCTFDNIELPNDVMFGEFEQCRFNNCTFYNFNGTEINFSGSVLSDCDITRCNFKDGDFTKAQLHHTSVSNSDFTNANFAAAKIGNTRFDRNDLSGVKFHGATLDDVIITDATVDKPVEGLYSENILLDGATHQEIETHRNRIVSELKLEPLSFEQIAEQAKTSLEPLPETHLEKANENLSFSNNQTIDDHTQLQFEIINKYNPAKPISERV